MTFFLYVFWFDSRFRKVEGGPMKFWELSDNLEALGHKVIVFAPRLGFPGRQTRARVIEIPTVSIPVFGVVLYEIQLFFLSLFLIWKEGCDAFYVRIMTSLVPLFFARLLARPFIVEINDDPYLRYRSEKGLLRMKMPLVRCVDRLNLSAAGKIFTVYGRIRRLLALTGGIAEEKISVMASGANTGLFRPYPRDEACARLGLDPGKQYVGFVGSYNYFHDYASLIASARIAVSQNDGIRYVIVGKEPEELPKVPPGMEKYFIFPGWVGYRQVPFYIAAMDVCCAPMKKEFGDALVVKVFDYLSCARPAVISAMGDYRFLEQEGCAIAVPPEDAPALAGAIMEILADRKKAAEMGEKGRALVLKNFDRLSLAREVAAAAERLSSGRQYR